MNTTLKSLITASLLLASMTITAQKVIVQDLETWMESLISKAIDNKVEVSKSFGQERDIQKEGTPLKWRCDIMTFTLPRKQRPLLDEMIKAFEANGHDNPYCYGINTLSTGNPQNEGLRNLMIGDDVNRYITIGKQYGNFVNVNILDAADTTKTHRYAYALEWKEDHKGNVFARYIVTYAKIPSASSTINRYNEIMNDKSFISNFNGLRDWYLEHENVELTAISIYRLFELGEMYGAFKNPDSVNDWEKVCIDVQQLRDLAKTETDRKYFQMALDLLKKMKGKKVNP